MTAHSLQQQKCVGCLVRSGEAEGEKGGVKQ